MSQSEFIQNGSTVVLNGKLDVDNVNRLFLRKLDYSGDHLEIDLSALIEIDSTGIALLVYWHQQGNARQCRVEFTNPDVQVETMIKISGLETMLNG
jgi:anti-anti-sigma factor